MTPNDAQQFAIILSSGVPAIEAMRYMRPDLEGSGLSDTLASWTKDRVVQRAIITLQGKAWEEMSLEEKISFAINKFYAEAAYYLYAHNYAELVGAERQKADVCRQALEAKLAGMAGKMDALTRFYDDLMKGRAPIARPAN